MVLGLIDMGLVNWDSSVNDRWLDGLLLDDWLYGLKQVSIMFSRFLQVNYEPHEHGGAHARQQ